jgi:hypothetical protein
MIMMTTTTMMMMTVLFLNTINNGWACGLVYCRTYDGPVWFILHRFGPEPDHHEAQARRNCRESSIPLDHSGISPGDSLVTHDFLLYLIFYLTPVNLIVYLALFFALYIGYISRF